MNRVYRAAFPALMLGAIACGASPVVPIPSDVLSGGAARVLVLPSGPYALELIGFGISTDPEFPPCDPPFLQNGRTAASTTVNLSLDQGEWVAVAMTSVGVLEMRFRQTGDSIRGLNVSGWMSGNAPDLTDNLGLADRGRVFVRGAENAARAVVEGLAHRGAPFLSGRVSGDLRFTNNDATAVSRCSVVLWTLQPISA